MLPSPIADCIPPKRLARNLVCEFDDGIVGVGGGIKNVGNGPSGRSPSLFALDTFLGGANSVQDQGCFRRSRFVRSISGWQQYLPEEGYHRGGGFDVRLSINEDTELNSRLQQLARSSTRRTAIVHHHQERGLEEFVRRMHFFGTVGV